MRLEFLQRSRRDRPLHSRGRAQPRLGKALMKQRAPTPVRQEPWTRFPADVLRVNRMSRPHAVCSLRGLWKHHDWNQFRRRRVCVWCLLRLASRSPVCVVLTFTIIREKRFHRWSAGAIKERQNKRHYHSSLKSHVSCRNRHNGHKRLQRDR
jgi:hypothetical protein